MSSSILISFQKTTLFTSFCTVKILIVLKLRLPICEIRCEIFQLFRSLGCFILPFTNIRNV